MFLPVSAFLLFLVSEVAYGEECAYFRRLLAYFCCFFANFATLKKLFQNCKCAHHPCTRRHLCAKFDVLRLSEISSGELILLSVNLNATHWGIATALNIKTQKNRHKMWMLECTSDEKRSQVLWKDVRGVICWSVLVQFEVVLSSRCLDWL